MKHILVWIFIVSFSWAGPAQAQFDVAKPIIQDLVNDGYKVSTVRRTLLGRILVIAKKGALVREVVINRRSGRVLHDHIFRNSSSSSSGTITSPPDTSNNTGNGSGGTGSGFGDGIGGFGGGGFDGGGFGDSGGGGFGGGMFD